MEGDYPTPVARGLFQDRLLRELRASPEIEHAALTSRMRMAIAGTSPIEIEGRNYVENRDRPTANFEQVSDGFFATLGMKLVEGRDFTADDDDLKQPVAIVNASFAKRNFGSETAVGRRFRTVINNGQVFGPWRTIVGVVSDVRMMGPFHNPSSEEYGFYLPLQAGALGAARAPVPPQYATIVVKPRGTPAPVFANNLRRAVKQVDPNLPLYFVGTPAENLAAFLGTNRVIAMMFSAFGAVAMVLAAVGLYGVMSFAVNQRTQEFGIRMALGADESSILGMVLRQGSIQLGTGLALGLTTAVAIAVYGEEGIRRQLNFNIAPIDPRTYAIVVALLVVVSLVATLIPARRATKVDPMVALRTE
jgi:putative ABC transport system permease protein